MSIPGKWALIYLRLGYMYYPLVTAALIPRVL